MQITVSPSSWEEFESVAGSERCTSILWERMEAEAPTYVRFQIPAQRLIALPTYPPWRTTLDGGTCIVAYEVDRTAAAIATFPEWGHKSHLFTSIKFVPGHDYLQTSLALSFFCDSCGIRLIKDGNHRLLQCAVSGTDPCFTVYEVRSHSWRRSSVDMKNFCACISNISLQRDRVG
jgi:hypothetical protein